MAPLPTGVILKFPIVETPETLSCCAVRLVVLVTPRVLIPEVLRLVLVKKSIVPLVVSNVLIVPIPVTFALRAVNSSKTISSDT